MNVPEVPLHLPRLCRLLSGRAAPFRSRPLLFLFFDSFPFGEAPPRHHPRFFETILSKSISSGSSSRGQPFQQRTLDHR